ncbi:PIN domain-containing protein [Acidithiobacillus thiooxidans]|uniref:PIN domain-containing protein n=1 Tax=Acidithiobacillus thiooxidans TaxID=930 RepID=UPI002DF7320A
MDTCVLSELVKKHPDSRVVTWVGARESVGFLSVLTLGELQKGVAKLVDGDRRAMLQVWIDVHQRARFVGRILPVNEHIASAWGNITGAAEQRGVKLPAIDSLLAARRWFTISLWPREILWIYSDAKFHWFIPGIKHRVAIGLFQAD